MARFGKVGNLQVAAVQLDEPVMTKLDEYLRISEAAEYVGVAPNTLRNWGKSGKLTERRHPVNGYRLYARDELDALLQLVNKPESKSTRTQNRKPK